MAPAVTMESQIKKIAESEGGIAVLIAAVRAAGWTVTERGTVTDRISIKIEESEAEAFIKLSQNIGQSHSDTALYVLDVKDVPVEKRVVREENEDDRKYVKGRMLHIAVSAAVKEKATANCEKLPPFMKPKSFNSLFRMTMYNVDLDTGERRGNAQLI